MLERKEKQIMLGDSPLVFETGRMAMQASGSILAKWGETSVLVTVTSAGAREGTDFFPLTVEYVERMYAGGLISSSRFVKRERFPSPEATLKARMIDRSVRPLFPENFRNEVQIIVTVLSFDNIHDPSILAINAASAALMISDLPFQGPIAGVRVSSKDGGLILHPNMTDYEGVDMNLVISASKDSVIMIDAGANQMPETVILEALEKAKAASVELLTFQEEIAKEWGVAKMEIKETEEDAAMVSDVRANCYDVIKDAVYINDRKVREAKFAEAMEAAHVAFEGKYSKANIDKVVHDVIKEVVVLGVVNEGKRPDGRGFDEIRPLGAEIGVLPRTHGSAIFQRGVTQALSVVTLGSGRQEQLVEDLSGESTKRYMHHYNFKPFCTGETGRYSYHPGRREIGHGALGEKALEPVIPSQDVFPYTIRVVSEILSASGSTSMAATCGSTLALMDAGVPITAPVAGIAIGLMKDPASDKTVLLTDIQGFEDHFGDMDFKITGTRKGITALQMDNKLKGIPMSVLADGMEKAKAARSRIIDLIEQIIPAPRPEISKLAPRISQVKIAIDKIGELIGPGGKMIRKITEATGAEVEIDDDGTVNVYSTSKESIDSAINMINGITFEPVPGQVYEGTVTRIESYGAFVQLSESVSGLVHISELKDGFVKNVDEVVKMGQKIMVKVMGIDEKGRVNLSAKAAVQKEAAPQE